jgi:hypothetical protein
MAGECKIRVGGYWGRSPIHPPMSSARNGRVVWSERGRRESGIEEIGLSLSLCVLGPW